MMELRILEDCRRIVRESFIIVKNNPQYKYSINDQLIRSSLSVGSNIAEGNQRKGKNRDRFMDIALGSLEECKFQLSVYPGQKKIYKELEDTFDKVRATIIRLKSPSSSSSSSQS